MNADHSIACGVFTNDDGRCTCKEAPDEKSPWLLDGELDVAHHYATRNRPLIENMDPRSESAAKHWLCTGCGYTYTSYAADQEPKQHGHCQRGIWARISKAHRV